MSLSQCPRWIVRFCIACITSYSVGSPALAADGPLIGRCVLLVADEAIDRKPERDGVYTAFFVESSGALYLVTHTANAIHCDEGASLGIDGKDRDVWVQLRDIARNHGDDMWLHAESMLSVMELKKTDESEPVFKEAQRVAVPLSKLAETSPNRTCAVEIVGYPVTVHCHRSEVETVDLIPDFGLGTAPNTYNMLFSNRRGVGAVSGIVVTTNVASREVAPPPDDGIRSVVFLSQHVSDKFAGAPVFVKSATDNNLACVGVFIGSWCELCAKSPISGMVPARILKAVIIECERNRSGGNAATHGRD